MLNRFAKATLMAVLLSSTAGFALAQDNPMVGGAAMSEDKSSTWPEPIRRAQAERTRAETAE